MVDPVGIAMAWQVSGWDKRHGTTYAREDYRGSAQPSHDQKKDKKGKKNRQVQSIKTKHVVMGSFWVKSQLGEMT
jgi:hypothetical protein